MYYVRTLVGTLEVGQYHSIASDRSCSDNRGMINKVINVLNIFVYKLHAKETQKCMRHAMIPKYILTFLPQIITDMLWA